MENHHDASSPAMSAYCANPRLGRDSRVKRESVQERVDRLVARCRLLSERIEIRPAIPSRELGDDDNVPEEYIVGGGKNGIRLFKLAWLYEDENGNPFLVPLYINNGKRQAPTEKWVVGKWYEAGVGEHKVEVDDETGEVVKYLKTTASLGSGLSFRPGLHCGGLPYAPHIYTQKANFGNDDLDGDVWNGEYEQDGKRKMVPGSGKAKYNQISDTAERRKYRDSFPYHTTRLQPKGTAWAEILVTYSRDDQNQAGRNGMQKLPQYGYKHKTNTSASSSVEWIISRYMKILKILTDQEVRDICASNNVVALDREGAEIATAPDN